MAKNFDKNFHKKFGKRIKELRKEKDLTQEELSLEIGAGNSYISIVENAQRDIPLSKIHKISKALGINLHDFFEFDK
ncbi:MAG TPA: transcriptional regulator [Cyanobacteria bacterium UBA9971]|nr:transcriptional regulator [Cyanobacteria bacterium UBA9971]